ncbi:MAG: hypothetical protein LBM59_06210 [Ruminococcus sp.]|jgi:hypothetical protein|nr:hypothetical protein [Ruminococcus sp.]
MKKEYIIKKAAECGITMDEKTADKYVNLSEEELENLDISGGACGDGNAKTETDKTETAKNANLTYDPRRSNNIKTATIDYPYNSGNNMKTL